MALSHVDLISDLQSRIRKCIDPLIGSAPVSLVDFPNYRNVGDSAIWLGQLKYFDARMRSGDLAYVSGMRDFSAADLDARAPSGAIFIQGGGTFGDIWEGHQRFRERILQCWPGRAVIQLPQSIHYNRSGRADETARIIENHGNFTLLVRDQESLEFASRRFNCRVLLCPDMALYLGVFPPLSPTLPVLAMLREDVEKGRDDNMPSSAGIPTEDWVTEPLMPICLAKMKALIASLPMCDRMRIRLRVYNAAAKQRLFRGVQQIGRARTIITDRLHVHIVSLLLGRPHAVLDNSYRKIGRFMNTFGVKTDLVYRARTLADAIEWAHAINQECEVHPGFRTP